MSDMTREEVIDRVMREGGAPVRADAERALRATLQSLGERLTADEASAASRELPGELAQLLDQAGYDRDFDAAELYERVRRRTGAPLGFAREQAQSVCRVLGEVLGVDGRARLQRALSPELAELFEPRAAYDLPPHGEAHHAPALTTLASGRPGSRHPLSEARPNRSQTHSVASEENPHADTKLSSARGLTQERHRESLATGHTPGPERPISEASDSEGGPT